MTPSTLTVLAPAGGLVRVSVSSALGWLQPDSDSPTALKSAMPTASCFFSGGFNFEERGNSCEKGSMVSNLDEYSPVLLCLAGF